MKEIEFKIKGLMMDPITNSPIVVLQDAESDTLLPIWVGIFEANAIALQIEKVDTPRPMTHDLMKGLLNHLNAKVTKIVVTELKDNTFYALIFLAVNGKVITVDSRPSDAIALFTERAHDRRFFARRLWLLCGQGKRGQAQKEDEQPVQLHRVVRFLACFRAPDDLADLTATGPCSRILTDGPLVAAHRLLPSDIALERGASAARSSFGESAFCSSARFFKWSRSLACRYSMYRAA